MTRKLTFLILALFALIAGPGWGQTKTDYTELFTVTSADVVSNSSYAAYTGTIDGRGWVITFGGNNKSVGTNSSNRSKCNLSSYSKYAVSPVTTSDVASAFVSTSSISDVSKISYTFNGGSNQTNTNVYLIYSSDGNTFSQMSLTSGTQGATISSGTKYEFAKCSGYFGLLFKATNTSGNWRIDDVNITFYESSTPSTDPVINADDVELAYDATSGEISYSITNPNPEASFGAETFASWISHLEITNDKVTFDTEVNTAAASRTATITLSYTGATSKDVTVTQAAAPQEGVLFYESFDTNNGTGGNDDKWYGSIASNDLESDNEDWTFVKGNGANKCAKFGTGSAKGSATTPSISYNGDATLTFKAAAWDGNSEGTTLNISATSGTLSQASVTLVKGAWTEYSIDITNVTNSTQIIFEAVNASNNRFFLDEVKVVEAEAPSVATPTFTPASGTYATAQNVTISCATEGASIYYTLDGTTPTDASTRYTSAITVSETTTIKAIAYSPMGETSSIASATYTIVAPLTTMDEIFAKATEAGETETDVYVTFNNWVISGVKGNNAYLTDNYGKGLIIYTSNHGFEVGDILNGTVTCKVQLYNGSAELTNLTATTSGLTVTTGGSLTPVEPSIADLSGVNTGAVITLNNVTYSGSDKFTDGEGNEIKAYNAFMTTSPSFTSGRQYNITGVYIQFGETKEIAPRTNDDIEEIVPTEPSITVAETLDIPYTGLEELETLEVTYENIDFEMLDLYFYDDPGCTIESENDWFIADFTEDGSHNIEYFASENTESTPRTVYMQINYNESELTKVITVTQEAAPQTYNVTLSSNGLVSVPQSVQGSITLSDPTKIPTGFTFAGWTESESNIQFVANPYTPTSNVILYAVFSRVEGGIAGSGNYEKVTEDLDDWSGTYLMAATNSTSSYAFNNIITSDWGKFAEITISDNTITKTQTTDSYEITIGETSTHGNYYLQISNGNYLSASAKTKFNTSETQNNYTSFNFILNDDGKIKITSTSSSSRTIQFNYNGGNGGFRFYDNGTQIIPDLYKKDEGTPGITKYYTRVYDVNTTIDDALTVQGPSIILSGYTLTVTGAMSNENAANLIIEDGAQLFQNSSNVMATVQKNITGYTGDNDNYYLIANPTNVATVAHLNDNNYDLYTFNPAGDGEGNEWINMKSSPAVANGTGYLYANSATTTLEFAGELTPATSSTFDLTYAEEGTGIDFPGFNLIGNPYACNATISGIYTFLKIDGDAILPSTGSVAPCEGIFVEATAAEQSVTFTPALPASQAAAPSAMSIEVSQNCSNVIDRAIVRFDGANDLHKFMLNPDHTNISLAMNGEDFAAVSTSSTSSELPVNFKAEKNGTYTITVNTENIDAEYLHLIDNMTGMDIDVLATPSYTFEAKTSDYASRFKLVFNVNNAASASSDSNFAYMSDGNLVISDIEGEATLQIIDMMGRVVSTETVSGNFCKALNLRAGAYVLNLNGMTQKIVVE